MKQRMEHKTKTPKPIKSVSVLGVVHWIAKSIAVNSNKDSSAINTRFLIFVRLGLRTNYFLLSLIESHNSTILVERISRLIISASS